MDEEKRAVCVYGVVNYGYAICGTPNFPSVAARVAYYMDLFEKDGGVNTTGRIKIGRNGQRDTTTKENDFTTSTSEPEPTKTKLTEKLPIHIIEKTSNMLSSETTRKSIVTSSDVLPDKRSIMASAQVIKENATDSAELKISASTATFEGFCLGMTIFYQFYSFMFVQL